MKKGNKGVYVVPIVGVLKLLFMRVPVIFGEILGNLVLKAWNSRVYPNRRTITMQCATATALSSAPLSNRVAR